MDFDEWLNRPISEEAGPHSGKFGDILNLIKSRMDCEGQQKELHEFARLAFIYGQFSERQLVNSRLQELHHIALETL